MYEDGFTGCPLCKVLAICLMQTILEIRSAISNFTIISVDVYDVNVWRTMLPPYVN